MDCKVETGLGRFLIVQYFGLKAKLTFIKFLEKLSKNISVVVPDLQIMGGWVPDHPDPEIRKEGTRSQKKTKRFRLFGPQFGLRIRRGPSPGSTTVNLVLQYLKMIK